MNAVVAGIITLFTAINIESFFVMLSKSPIYTVYLGTVHYPMDFMYYLSYITQGREHWFRAYQVFTGEGTHLEYINWVYVFAGRIGHMFHLGAPVTNLLFIVVASVIYLFIAYRLVYVLFPENKMLRLLCFVLFLLSNAFPNIHQKNGAWVFSYYYPYYNFGHPFIRLTNVPHHLLIQSAIMASYILVSRYWQKYSGKLLIGFALTGLFLGSTQPLQWAFTAGILGAGGAVILWKRYRHGSLIHILRQTLPLLPAVVMVLAGLIPALYLKHLLTDPVYALGASWEAGQQIRIPFLHLIRLNGPLAVTGLLALPFVLRRISPALALLLLNTVITTLLFFSDIPRRLAVMNLRFFSVIPTLAIAALTSHGLWMLGKRLDPRRIRIFVFFAAVLIMAITVPVTVQQLRERHNVAPTNDVNAYLPLGASMAFDEAKKEVGPLDIVLIEPLFAQPFAAMTGRHVFVSNSVATLDYHRKIAEATTFIYTPQSPEEKLAFLLKNNISYLWVYAWTPVILPGVINIYENDYARLYKVTK